jgi:hypothetical protein
MALQNGIDTVALLTFGVFTETYGAGEGGNIAALFLSRGLLEDARTSINRAMKLYRSRYLYSVTRKRMGAE